MVVSKDQKTVRGFLLTTQWRDTDSGVALGFWAASDQGPIRIVHTRQRSVAFVPTDSRFPSAGPASGRCVRRQLQLQSLGGEPVDALYCNSQRELRRLREEALRAGAQIFESDLKPTDRYLMERFIRGGFEARGEPVQRDRFLELRNPQMRAAIVQPKLKALAIDIETSDLEGQLYSIAGVTETEERVFMIGNGSGGASEAAGIDWCRNEAEILSAFFAWLRMVDPDLVLGWNVLGFDLTFLERRCRQLGIPFRLGRGDEDATILQPNSHRQLRVARIPGRVVLDGIDALRTATRVFENYALEHVAHAVLGRGKLIEEWDKVAEIRRLFVEDKLRLAAYNLEDCRLVLEIFEAVHLVPFLIERTKMTGLPLDRQGGSVAAFDNVYLPKLHRRGFVASDVGANPNREPSPGGFVLDSQPGLYDNILTLDFKSLYPSIIRTFMIDPLGLACPGDDPIQGFLGGSFAREGAILPELIAELWLARDRAKSVGDSAMSQAIKLLMNSFYGVLGSAGSRFFDPRLASSITRRGHEIINRSRQVIEEQGWSVIYGDTDSLFVSVGGHRDEQSALDIGPDLARSLNTWWRETLAREHRLESFLEIEFETHYLKFVMPTVRGAETGSKKRYAGLVRDGTGYRLVFKGLESVRTDWTPLAREFQRELYRRVFLGEPYEDYVRDTLSSLRHGDLDDLLVYRKRLRRPLDAYHKNVPPHVRAARMLDKPGRHIEYLITVRGPEPRQARRSPLDYDHYVDRQLAPVADGILHFLGCQFDTFACRQLSLF